MPVSELFWNSPTRVALERANDPLGFDALREAMADVLVPFLTGATRNVRHFTAAAVGLYWALEYYEDSRHPDATTTDKEIWAYFERFERAVKHYWVRHLRYKDFLGKRRVLEAAAEKPYGPIDLDAPILVNQRGIGLLASHLRSLRAIGLVEPNSLRVVKEFFFGRFLVPPRGRFDQEKSRVTVRQLDIDLGILRKLEVRGRAPLGRLLFGPFADESSGASDEHRDRRRMERAARAVRQGRMSARTWTDLAPALGRREHADPEQVRLANAVETVVRFERAARVGFGQLLGGAKHIAKSDRARLERFAAAFRRVSPFPEAWDRTTEARTALETAALRLEEKVAPEGVLIDLHVNTMKLRNREPWILEAGQNVSAEFRTLSSSARDPDLRLDNLCSLIRETRWAGARGGSVA
jgi:hypothetical protein